MGSRTVLAFGNPEPCNMQVSFSPKTLIIRLLASWNPGCAERVLSVSISCFYFVLSIPRSLLRINLPLSEVPRNSTRAVLEKQEEERRQTEGQVGRTAHRTEKPAEEGRGGSRFTPAVTKLLWEIRKEELILRPT